jgi:hypothetical protein
VVEFNYSVDLCRLRERAYLHAKSRDLNPIMKVRKYETPTAGYLLAVHPVWRVRGRRATPRMLLNSGQSYTVCRDPTDLSWNSNFRRRSSN